jgi:hypothetical protein
MSEQHYTSCDFRMDFRNETIQRLKSIFGEEYKKLIKHEEVVVPPIPHPSINYLTKKPILINGYYYCNNLQIY